MNYEMIRLDIDLRGVATVSLARAEKHNAMNARMIDELNDVAKSLAANGDVRVVVLVANGKTFCAGGDLGWMRDQAELDRDGKMTGAKALSEMLHAWNSLPKPVIGRVQGAAYGGGLGLISVCDIVVMAENIKLALTETRLGLIPATIGPFVVRRLGEAFARQVFFNAKLFGAEFALRSGLAAVVCRDQDLDEKVEQEISSLLGCAPGAVAAAKQICRQLSETPLSETVELTAGALADRWETDETRDGIAAFFDRKDPPWRKAS
ncbi:crotonase/enoyl-CoA hydratase family protein [Thalassospira sp. NFXS8]|uniref:crotonase/enoyl-CoA hydratase family protein n=1 Tax=Thalassospira TaxID=168934 RepID=UPI0003B3E519|nr:crotonase/enoyl-CoA hydratase family protein [Thalassospira lucentensis]RCK30404.1 enoyl-CoA hydratase [Thalassospira lucentensis MCCC 1A00383 = DSM 14000]